MAELNQHFKTVTEGAPQEVMARLGEALLDIHAQRTGQKVDSPAKLRSACFALNKHIISRGVSMNPAQELFLLTGALADSVTLKDPRGERVEIELLPTPVYEALLKGITEKDSVLRGLEFLMVPLNRLKAIASGEMKPLDLNKPGRYRPPVEGAGKTVSIDTQIGALGDARKALSQALNELGQAGRGFAGCFQSDRLAPVLLAVGELTKAAQQAIAIDGDPQAVANLSTPAGLDSGKLRSLRSQVDGAVMALEDAQQELMLAFSQYKQLGNSIVSAQSGEGPVEAVSEIVSITPDDLRNAEKDYSSTNNVMVQLLLNNPQRTSWSASRVLLKEHTERFDDPLMECYATPQNLKKSIELAEKLHPDCFPHDSLGNPILPPVIIEPGNGVVKWYDDRFVLGFTCLDTPRKGAKLSLSPVDIAVLQIYGLFTARGDLYDYRGDRVSGNFIADYAGQIEQKAVAKFAGDSKKLTYTTSTEVKDAASREDAVDDYIDFIYHVYNGLPIPKKINARRIGVILTYCTIGGVQFTANLALRYVMQHDYNMVRNILLRLADRDAKRVIALIKAAMAEDPQVASKYRKDVFVAVNEVMGREFAMEAVNKGLISRGGAEPAEVPGDAADGDEAAPQGHDYFDV